MFPILIESDDETDTNNQVIPSCAEVKVETQTSGDLGSHEIPTHSVIQEVNERNVSVQFLEGSNENNGKKKKKKRPNTICFFNCKFDVIRKTAKKLGMREIGITSEWNVFWTDFVISVDRARALKVFQRINHFPGITEIARKSLLSKNLNRMLKLYPNDYNIFPKTWLLPMDYISVMKYGRLHKHGTFILKPETGCRGEGIFLTKNIAAALRNGDKRRLIAQVYIERPFLIDGFKFDLRIYTLITSCDPLRMYVYNEGIARFATCRYKRPTPANLSNLYMHLTNYSLNKNSSTYVYDDEAGSKRRLSTLNRWLQDELCDVESLWISIDEVIVKTILSGLPVLRHAYRASFPLRSNLQPCFELLGFDILITNKLKPYIIEVNHSPSFHTDTLLDKEIKESLLIDTFNILNLAQNDKKKILREEKKRVEGRLLTTPKDEMDDSKYINSIQQQLEWEEKNMGNYRRVYPCEDSDKYQIFISQPNGSIYKDTHSSRARQEATMVLIQNLKDKKFKEELMRSTAPSAKMMNSEYSSKASQQNP